MITLHTVSDLRAAVKAARLSGKSIGFVPTMGNLHAGHISLVDQAKKECDFVVASIFVNPLQFNDKSDLSRYPRTLPDDQVRLTAANCDLLFAPDVDEMYPVGQDNQSTVSVPGVSTGLCGGSRPGHFDGVATVVTKLFNQVLPDRAFFGEKDFQQVAVIRKMVEDLCQPVAIVTVPTARDHDGLALSSRNGYLTPEERALAPGLYLTLTEIGTSVQAGEPVSQVLSDATERLNQRGFRTDYLEIRDARTLSEDLSDTSELVILGAAFLGKARLIDNIVVTLKRRND